MTSISSPVPPPRLLWPYKCLLCPCIVLVYKFPSDCAYVFVEFECWWPYKCLPVPVQKPCMCSVLTQNLPLMSLFPMRFSDSDMTTSFIFFPPQYICRQNHICCLSSNPSLHINHTPYPPPNHCQTALRRALPCPCKVARRI